MIRNRPAARRWRPESPVVAGPLRLAGQAQRLHPVGDVLGSDYRRVVRKEAHSGRARPLGQRHDRYGQRTGPAAADVASLRDFRPLGEPNQSGWSTPAALRPRPTAEVPSVARRTLASSTTAECSRSLGAPEGDRRRPCPRPSGTTLPGGEEPIAAWPRPLPRRPPARRDRVVAVVPVAQIAFDPSQHVHERRAGPSMLVIDTRSCRRTVACPSRGGGTGR
jgi:hypothetical protein